MVEIVDVVSSWVHQCYLRLLVRITIVVSGRCHQFYKLLELAVLLLTSGQWLESPILSVTMSVVIIVKIVSGLSLMLSVVRFFKCQKF